MTSWSQKVVITVPDYLYTKDILGTIPAHEEEDVEEDLDYDEYQDQTGAAPTEEQENEGDDEQLGDGDQKQGQRKQIDRMKPEKRLHRNGVSPSSQIPNGIKRKKKCPNRYGEWESGTKVHHANIHVEMLIDAAGGIVVTNDGNAILRELDLAHTAAKSMIELSRTYGLYLKSI
ncbi:hypothetical protein V6N11_029114 [Hibiscus sabdariffa]|uniref:Uncharacterized protein n=1 Tax=Hibiscus sabdariffa TaxID=183260 RepID=A0ABR2NRF4_9ROSI